jgi:hypothetical protein
MRKEFLAVIAGTIFLMAILYWNDTSKSVDKITPIAASARNQPELESEAPQENFIQHSTSSDVTVTSTTVQVAEA